MRYVFKSGEFTSIGRNPKRPVNEDFVGKYEPYDDPTLSERGYLYVVADGMGGHAAGEVASRYAVERVLYEYYNSAWIDPATNLQRAIEIANRDVYEESLRNPIREGMGTTIVAAALRDDGEVTIAHVGDSRAYLVRDNQIRQLTWDHTRVQEDLDSGLITEVDVPYHKGRNVLTETIGGDTDVRVELTYETLQADDYLLLCTDGLWDVVGAGGLERAVHGIRQPGLAARAMVEEADRRGGPDNSTACVIRAVPATSEEATIITAEEDEDPTVDVPAAPKFEEASAVETTPTLEPEPEQWYADLRLLLSGMAVLLLVALAGWRLLGGFSNTGAPNVEKTATVAPTEGSNPGAVVASTSSSTPTATTTPAVVLTESPTPQQGLAPAATMTEPARSPTGSTATYDAFNYMVHLGDDLSSIAAQFGITVDEIRQANNITMTQSLTPGQELVIPLLRCQDLIRNGGFERDLDDTYGPDAWETSGDWQTGEPAIWTEVIDGPTAEPHAHDGRFAVFMGLQEDATNREHMAEVRQSVQLPDAAEHIWLTFWHYTSLGDPEGDAAYVEFQTDGGETISLPWQPTTPEVAGQWRQELFEFSQDLKPHLGETVQLVFGMHNDGDGQEKSYVRIDDVSLFACETGVESP